MANDNDNIEEHSILLAVMQETLVNYLCWSVMSGVDTCYCCVSDDTELGCEQEAPVLVSDTWEEDVRVGTALPSSGHHPSLSTSLTVAVSHL